MRATALYIAKGSRRPGRCGYCGASGMWALMAARGARKILLVATPIVLREERDDRDVTVEVLGWDQVHACPEKKASRRVATHSAATTPRGHGRKAEHVFHAFTKERIDELKAQLETPKLKPPQTGRLW